MNDLFETVDYLMQHGEDELARLNRPRRDTWFSSLRLEVIFRRAASADNGAARRSTVTQSAGLGMSVLARSGAALGFGYSGLELGSEARSAHKLLAALRAGYARAYERARYNARQAAALARSRPGPTPGWVATPSQRSNLPARFARDPTGLAQSELEALCRQVSGEIGGLGREVVFNSVSAMTELRRELLITSEGSVLAQGFAFAQGDCYVVAQSAQGHDESHDSIGQQLGPEVLFEGGGEPPMVTPSLRQFALDLAGEARMLAAAPALRPSEEEAVVVTDPHFNALVAHEIVGHPSEADRALKMEAGYAGRSWFLRSLSDNQIGCQIGSALLSACSDPSLPGYGHYAYDHEGVAGQRVTHIDRGIYVDFLNSRATAAILGVAPNGSARASAAPYAPLIRMSNTFILPGQRTPEEIIGEVNHGYYVCGSRTPSIAESRENFRISARRVYAIEHGRLGQLYRAGSLAADAKRFFSQIDAAGNDLHLFAIPNCGKGQPMQIKRMSNGGPTLRSRGYLLGV
ncbi:MAG TPA: TldD/PmbA family protein [Candidatus Binataceae bacterium]|nr:TldD/PmbA family protein [Candidatus Binataceae bacterium]